MSGIVQTNNAGSASSGHEMELLSKEYRKKLQSIIRDVGTVWRSPIQVFPFSNKGSVLDTMERYNAQFEELERILERLCRENCIPNFNQAKKKPNKKSEYMEVHHEQREFQTGF